MPDRPRCGKRYGKRKLICRRYANHKGQHALRLSVAELSATLKKRVRS